MGVFDHFPYTNFHELNLEWILLALQEIQQTMRDFVSLNAIKYADPIQWDITRQYEKNTIVIDPFTGTAYISVRPVPSGANITDTDYWTVVFDLGQFVVKMAQNLAHVYEPETTLTATVASSYNDWIIWGDILYRNINPAGIIPGDQYVVGSNLEQFNIEDVIGHIQDLNTTDKSNLVAAINEVLQTLTDTTGDLNDLNTTDKSNLVAAINEVLQTLTDTTGDLNDLNTTDKSNLVAAINEVLQTLADTTGDLNDLNTTDKSNLVAAANEILQKTDDAILRLDNSMISNVRDFGAAGDGVTDDTTAVLNALSDALTNKKALFFPSGNYLITSSLNIPYTADDLLIYGNKAVITASGVSELFNITGLSTSDYAVNITIDNITVHGDGNTIAVSVNYGFSCKLLNFTSDGCAKGLYVKNTYGMDVINCNFYNNVVCGIQYGDSDSVEHGNGLMITKCTMDNPVGAQPTAGGLYWVSGEGVYCVNVEMIRQNNNLLIEPPTGQYCAWGYFTNLILDLGSNNGIYLHGAGGNIFGIKLDNSWMGTNTIGALVYAEDANSLIHGFGCTNCNVYNNAQGGIYFKSVAGNVIRSVVLTGNHLDGNSRALDQTYNGIDTFDADVDFMTVTGNVVSGRQTFDTTQHRIALYIGPRVNDIVVTGNILDASQIGIQLDSVMVTRIANNINGAIAKDIYIGANQLTPVGTGAIAQAFAPNYPSVITLPNNYIVGASGQFEAPENNAFGYPAELWVYLISDTTGTGTVILNMFYGEVLTGGSLSQFLNPITLNVDLTANVPMVYSLNVMQYGINPKFIEWFSLVRDGVTDTFAGDIHILGVKYVTAAF